VRSMSYLMSMQYTRVTHAQDDVVPDTVANFLSVRELFPHSACFRQAPSFVQLCHGTASDKTGYKGSKIHNIRRGYGMTGGDYILGNGLGGRSSTGAALVDENFVGRHTEPGTISMANSGVDSNSSVFFISTTSCPHLDGRHVVFGKVVGGLTTVQAATGVLQVNGRPSVPLTIANAGLHKTEEGR